MSVPLPIDTERLTIREFVPQQDAREMLSVYGDSAVMRFIPGGALADVAEVRALLEQYVQRSRERGFSSWALVERATGRLIGDAGLALFGPAQDVELGYTLGREHWDHGFATEAARACLAAAIEHLRPPRVIAVVDEENLASQRVAERIGMIRVDTVETNGRPHALFSTTS